MKRKTPSAIPIFHGRRWPVGIGNASKRLKVSRPHLQMVLTGQRKSQRVTEGYAELVKELEAAS